MGAALLLGSLGVSATPITYTLVGQTTENFSATGTITTDGNLGLLAIGNVVSSAITIFSPSTPAGIILDSNPFPILQCDCFCHCVDLWSARCGAGAYSFAPVIVATPLREGCGFWDSETFG